MNKLRFPKIVDWINAQLSMGRFEIQRQVFESVKILSKRLKKAKEQKKNKKSVLAAESAYNSQNTV